MSTGLGDYYASGSRCNDEDFGIPEAEVFMANKANGLTAGSGV